MSNTAPSFEELEGIIKNVAEQCNAINAKLGQVFTEAQITDLIKQHVSVALEEAIAGSNESARKLRFGTQSPAALVGSKFARFGLGVSDVEFLYDLQTSLSGQKRVNGSGVYAGPSNELANAFKAISEAAYMTPEEVKAIDRQALDDVFPRVSKANVRALDAAIKAMDSAESGFGSQLVGAQYVGELWDAARLSARIAPLLDQFEMTAPTTYLPVEVDIPEMLFVAENTANNSSDYSTVKTGSQRVTVTAKKFLIHQMWSGEMEEDSIIPFIPFLRRQAQIALAYYTDSAILNGDDTNAATGNINLDDADPADTKHYLAFDGIRHAAIVDNTANAVNHAGAAVTWAALRDLRAKMRDATRLQHWGHPSDPNDLVYVVDPDSADAIEKLDEIKTVDRYGNGATVLTGEVAKIARNPVITTDVMSRTEADGKVSTTAGNNTLGQVAAFNRRAFKIGFRRRVMLETERLPGRDQTRLVYSLRMGFGRYTPTGAASGIEAAAVLYNIL